MNFLGMKPVTLFSGAVCTAVIMAMTTNSSPLQAWLSTKEEKGILTIEGHCRNTSALPVSGRYELLVQRTGSGGKSTNQQQGRFDLTPGQSVVLSQIRMNVDAYTSYTGKLKILGPDGQVLMQDSVRQEAAHP
jgi:hypothetical protein